MLSLWKDICYMFTFRDELRGMLVIMSVWLLVAQYLAALDSFSCKVPNSCLAVDYTLTGWVPHRDPTEHVANSHKY